MFGVCCSVIPLWLVASEPVRTSVTYIRGAVHPFVTVVWFKLLAVLITSVTFGTSFVAAGGAVADIYLSADAFIRTVINGCVVHAVCIDKSAFHLSRNG